MLRKILIASPLLLGLAACGGTGVVDPLTDRQVDYAAMNRAAHAVDRQAAKQSMLEAEAQKATYKIVEGFWTFDYTGSQSAMIMHEGLAHAGFDVVDVKTHGPTRYMMAKHPLTEIYGNIRVGLTYRVRPATIDVKLSMRGPADFSPDLADRLASEIREGIVAQIEGLSVPVRSLH